MRRKGVNRLIEEILANPQKAVELFERDMENTARQIEARHAAIQENAARLAQENQSLVGAKGYKRISLDGRVGKRPTRLYVTKVSFAPGDGWKVSKLWYAPEIAKAKEFSTGAALGISEYLVRCGYTPHVENV